MARLTLPSPATFETIDSRLGRRETLRAGHNTDLVRRGPDAIALRLWSTDVATWTRTGYLVLATGGWQTVITADRIRQAMPSPWNLYSVRGTWNLAYAGRRVAMFADGIAIRLVDDALYLAEPWGARWGATERYALVPLMSAEDIAAAVSAEDARRAVLDARRAVRMARAHEAGHPVRAGSWREPGWAWDCPACPSRTDYLAAQHAAGRHPDPFRRRWDCVACREAAVDAERAPLTRRLETGGHPWTS